jgi:hypothetical protein
MKRVVNAVYGDLKPGDLFMRPGKDFVYEKLFGGWYWRTTSMVLAYPNPKFRLATNTPVTKLT